MNEYLRDINDLLSAIVVVILVIAAIVFICGVVVSVLKKRSAELESAQAELELKYATGPLPIRMSDEDIREYRRICEVGLEAKDKTFKLYKKYAEIAGLSPDQISIRHDGTIIKF